MLKLLTLFPFLLAGYLFSSSSLPAGCNKGPAVQTDGPYVLYKNGFVYTLYIDEQDGNTVVRKDSLPLAQKNTLELQVNTDIPGKTFPVRLQNNLSVQPTTYHNVPRQFVVSDIEGSFGAFRKLLQAGGVIDDSFNWTFGDGHLVLTGDFFDRGNKVTEVLWLIYSLEEKAAAAGGRVHFILGNHEIMNLSGDLRYVNQRYLLYASLLQEQYISLYGEQSELGRWLRTKNIMEKIGDVLYIHAGISGEVNNMGLTADSINLKARPFYPDSLYQYPDPRLNIIFGDLGPLWYRGYYKGAVKASQGQVDSTLAKFGVSRIATGHTVIADTISVLYNNKVFNTDVHHARGHSEGLLMDNGKYYRISGTGERFEIGL